MELGYLMDEALAHIIEPGNVLVLRKKLSRALLLELGLGFGHDFDVLAD
jgi:hypothetical protein